MRPALLVLDEPTAHLDPAAARALIQDVFAAAGDAAVLLITHRPEGLDLADELLELSNGEICVDSLARCGEKRRRGDL